MRSNLLLALPLFAVVQAEQVCKVVTKTITGDAVWFPTGATGVPQQHEWLGVGQGDNWTGGEGKPGNGNGSHGPGNGGTPDEGNGPQRPPNHGGKPEDNNGVKPPGDGGNGEHQPPHNGDKPGNGNGSHQPPNHGGNHNGGDGPQGPGNHNGHPGHNSAASTTTSKGHGHGGPGVPTSSSTAFATATWSDYWSNLPGDSSTTGTTSASKGHDTSSTSKGQSFTTTRSSSTTREYEHETSSTKKHETSSTKNEGTTTTSSSATKDHEHMTSSTAKDHIPTASSSSTISIGTGGGVLCTATSTNYDTVTENSTKTVEGDKHTALETSFTTVVATETAPAVTGTFSTTTTIIVIDTISEIVSEVSTIFETAFLTTDAATSTIPAPAGFTPIQSSYPESGRVPNEHEMPSAPEDPPVVPRWKRDVNVLHIDDTDLPHCTATTTFTVKETSTLILDETVTLPAVTETSTATETIHSTTTLPGGEASTTTTFSETSHTATTMYSTHTTSTTSTTTSTIFTGPTPTTYAACASSNILTNYANQQIDGIGPYDAFSIGYGETAYDCCVQCVTAADGTCAASAYGKGVCYFAKPNVGAACDGAKHDSVFFGNALLTEGFSVMNGGCGGWYFQAL